MEIRFPDTSETSGIKHSDHKDKTCFLSIKLVLYINYLQQLYKNRAYMLLHKQSCLMSNTKHVNEAIVFYIIVSQHRKLILYICDPFSIHH